MLYFSKLIDKFKSNKNERAPLISAANTAPAAPQPIQITEEQQQQILNTCVSNIEAMLKKTGYTSANDILKELTKVIDVEIDPLSVIIGIKVLENHKGLRQEVIERLFETSTNDVIKSYIDFAGPTGVTPLISATSQGDDKLVHYYILNDVELDAQMNPLGHDDTTLKSDGKANQIKQGFTALMEACSKGNLTIVKLLLEAGADPMIQTHDGKTALDYIGNEKKHAPDIRRLVEKATQSQRHSPQ